MTEKGKKELQVSEKKPIEKSSGEPTRQGVSFVPEVDIAEDAEAVTLYADLPGVKKENVSIDIHEGVLTITATVDPIPSNHHPLYREYDIGGFTRRFSLGEKVNQDKISATINNGVLTLVLAKAAELKPRKIEIRGT